MAKKEFILQGATSQTHADAVRRLFDVQHIQRVVLSVAFVTESGVGLIENEIKANAGKATVLAGIRNDITSQQALKKLLGLGGALYAVDTGYRAVIFHPKLYLVRGKTQARVIIGSANLTLGGLNNNIEAGVLLNLDLSDAGDNAFIADIEQKIDALPTDYPEHVFRVRTIKQIGEFAVSGRVVDEMAVPPPRPSRSVSSGIGDSVTRIKLKVVPLRRPFSTVKKKATPIKVVTASETKEIAAHKIVPPTVGVELTLVWESKALTRRDLTIPDAKNTHATGSINLDKGLLPEEVDHRHYFRDDVFHALQWAPTKTGNEESYAKFQLVIKGVNYGEFKLRLGHTTSTTSKAYIQKNAMTRLSWGDMREYVAEPSLIGRTLSLYRDGADSTRFLLDID